MAALWENNGQMGQFPLEQWFYEMPPVTRWWTVATVATSVLVQCHIVTPFQLFYSFRTVYAKSQYWRLLSTSIYFVVAGRQGIVFMIQLINFTPTPNLYP